MRKKIVLIGAGSAAFTQGLVADLILSPDFEGCELGLVDIDPQALETAEGIARRMIESRKSEIIISTSTDCRDILPNALVVVTTIGVGGRRAWEQDVFIPRKYDIYQPVGDTVMPGGISRALRMIPPLVKIANSIAELCPNAWFFNYSNPMSANCCAIRQATNVPVVGLCHGVFHVERQLADFIGAPPKEVTSLYTGINHCTFIYDFRWKGRDALPLIQARLNQERGESACLTKLKEIFPEIDGFSNEVQSASNPFSWSIFDTYQAYPAVNDRHVVEFFPERFPNGAYYGKTLGVDAFSFENTIAGGDNAYVAMQAISTGKKPLDNGIFQRSAGEHEQVLDILHCMEHGQRRIFSVNLPNLGAVPNLPFGAVLELPAVATATGFRAIQLPDFPNTLASIVNRKLTAIQLTVEAALNGDRGLFIEALLADGAVVDPNVAGKMADELLEAHRSNLSAFF
ncbi:TPA: hypothetical protein EYN23_24625 [Candidatus Poribacteria bacterium]|nr:hypothetical protein [Candidatus Poribacteria bacterium]